MGLNAAERPTWFTTVVTAETFANKKRKTSDGKPSTQTKMSVYQEKVLSPREQVDFEDTIALHLIISGSAFKRVDEENLIKSYALLNKSAEVPTRKQVAGPLLTRLYDFYREVAFAWLVGVVVCLSSDAWTNVLGLPVVNYMAVNKDKSLFIESVTDGVKHDAKWLGDDATRVINDLTSKGVYH